jgi:malate/lactate dehydrogenase
VCEGLRNPVDVLVNQVLKYSEDTPSTVIIAATTLAVAYDGGCDG